MSDYKNYSRLTLATIIKNLEKQKDKESKESLKRAKKAYNDKTKIKPGN